MSRIIKLFAAIVSIASLDLKVQAAPQELVSGFPADLALSVADQGSVTLDVPTIFLFLDSLNNPGGIPGIPDPTPFASDYSGGPVDANDYLFILYGTPGSAVVAPTGTVTVIFFPEAQASYSFTTPDPGFALLYDHVPAPDGGLTLALLGSGVIGVTFARRAISNRQ